MATSMVPWILFELALCSITRYLSNSMIPSIARFQTMFILLIFCFAYEERLVGLRDLDAKKERRFLWIPLRFVKLNSCELSGPDFANFEQTWVTPVMLKIISPKLEMFCKKFDRAHTMLELCVIKCSTDSNATKLITASIDQCSP